MKKLFRFFLVFLKIGAFTFGGGLAMLPLIEREIVDNNRWMAREEFIDAIAIIQCMPGVIAVNTAVYIGHLLFGFWGTVFGVLGAVFPAYLIMIIAAEFFLTFRSHPIVQAVFMGVRPAVAVLIFSAAVRLSKVVEKSPQNIIIAIGTMVSISLLGIHPIIVLVIAAFVGIAMGRRHVDNGNAS